MFRFLVTGACTVLLTATSFAIGGAAETALPPAVTVATAAVDAAPASQATSVRAATIEAVAPTAGADLAMWGVDPSTQATPAESRLSGSRLVRRFADGIINRSAQLAVTLTRNAMRFLGVPYVTVSAHSRHMQRRCNLDSAETRQTSQNNADWANG